eukprot:6627970-Alexandrium_andersonii.AAC.1
MPRDPQEAVQAYPAAVEPPRPPSPAAGHVAAPPPGAGDGQLTIRALVQRLLERCDDLSAEDEET